MVPFSLISAKNDRPNDGTTTAHLAKTTDVDLHAARHRVACWAANGAALFVDSVVLVKGVGGCMAGPAPLLAYLLIPIAGLASVAVTGSGIGTLTAIRANRGAINADGDG